MPKQALSNKGAARPFSTCSVLALLDGLTSEEISHLAIDIIHENRRRVNAAQILFEKLEEFETAGRSVQALENLRREYRVAMLELKIHHELVRLIVEVLGHVPDLSEDRSLQ